MKVLKTNTNEYFVDVNTDGTLTIKVGKDPIRNAGAFINNIGGIEAVLAKCVDYTDEEWEAEKQRRREIKKAKAEKALAEEKEKANEVKTAFNEAFKGGKGEASIHNIYVLLNYVKHFGELDLPTMPVGYSCNRYDCDGKTAAAIKLDEPIEYDGEMISQFQVGAPVGYLTKYHRIADI